MGAFEGLLSGFAGRKAEVEAYNLDEAHRAQQREGKILDALINSPDPEIKSMAVAGLLHSAQPQKRKGGLRGWIGEMQESPYLEQIRGLVQTPRTVMEPTATGTTLPSVQTSGYLSTPPGQESSMAQPSTSPTEVGAPPPSPVETRLQSTPSAGITTYTDRPVLRPREVFRTPEEQTRLTKTATAQGTVEGEVAGLTTALGGTPEAAARARDLIAKKYERLHGGGAGGGYQSTPGEITDPETGQPSRVYGAFDKTRGQYIGTDPDSPYYGIPIPGFIPRTTGAGLTPEQAGARATAVTVARGAAAAGVPLSTSQRFDKTEKLAGDWQKIQAPTREMQRQFQLMQTGLKRFNEGDKIGGSQAVLVTFQKILDPSSVVRESEYARSGEGLSLASRLEGYIQRLKEGGAGVPPAELAAMVETGRQFLAGLQTWNDAERKRIEGTAQGYGIDPGQIFAAPSGVGTAPPPPGGATVPAPGAAPPPATVAGTTPPGPFQAGAIRPAPSHGAAPPAGGGINAPIPGWQVDLDTGKLVAMPGR